jgi:rubrerythrin
MVNQKEINEKIRKISEKEVLAVKEYLLELYNTELFERNLYFQEMRKFDGKELETIKWLSVQEETHANVLEMILSRANVMVKETPPVMPTLSSIKKEIIKMDIMNETRAVNNYITTIAKTTGNLREVLTEIMQEELKHIKRLEEYL